MTEIYSTKGIPRIVKLVNLVSGACVQGISSACVQLEFIMTQKLV